jgi:lysophospholipase L1-like esterase
LKSTQSCSLKKINLKFVLFLLIISSVIYSQQTSKRQSANMDSIKINAIENVSNTNSILFIDKLKSLRNQTSQKDVSIIHIGDSHIQGGVFTNAIRIGLENYFGKGGTGLIFPHKLAKTNGVSNPNFSSKNNWSSKKITTKVGQEDSGIMGYVIQTKDSNVQLNYSSKKDSSRFNRIKIFATTSNDSLRLTTDSIFPKSYKLIDNFLDISLEKSIDKFKIEFKSVKDSITNFYGISIEDDSVNGLIYNSIGVNGAKFSDYNASPIFWKQLQNLEADCVILSLGTNEAQGNLDLFYTDLSETVSKLKQIYPSAAIIITTPPISYYKKIRPNSRVKIIAEIIKKFCSENEVCYWDLYSVQKEIDPKVHWKRNKLLRPDLVHYSTEGYQLQAQLFLKAFHKLGFEDIKSD